MAEQHHILAGWLINGKGDPIRERILLTIADGKVVALQDWHPDAGSPEGRVIDLLHGVLLPPLIDSHVHLHMSGTTDEEVRRDQLVADYGSASQAIARHLRDHFSHGVLAVRDGGDEQGHVLRYKVEHHGALSVTLQTSGKAWHARGRYGRLIGRCPAVGECLDQAFVRDGEAVDQVKVACSGPNSLRQFAKETAPQFNLEELRNLVRLAGERGLDVMVHANGKVPVGQALEAGCRSIEHGFFMGRDNLARMADQGTYWVPTIFAMHALGSSKGDADVSVVRRTVDHQLDQLRLARDLGVRVALGTDAGSIGVLHGESVVEEMKFLIKAGYSLVEAVQCATMHGAKLLGLSTRGVIMPGCRADFLVARGTPAMLPRKLAYLEAIYVGGEVCSKELYNKI